MDYTDIQIIECNKKQSVAGTDINSENAIFTNKIGSNITLNEGDMVSVEYSFINERGCGSDTIEIEGKEIGKDTKRFYYTAEEQEGIDRSIDILDASGNIKYPIFKTLERRQIIHNELKFVDKMLRDDEVNIQQYYYRSTNCEQYCFLPRRFISSVANLDSKTPHTTIWSQEHSQPFNYDIEGADKMPDPATNGACGVVMSNRNCIYSEDYKQLPWKTKTGATNQHYGYIPKTTAEKYTILVRDMTIVDIEYDNNKYLNSYQGRTRNSPSMRKYNIFTTLNTIKVDKGFNSPQNIASKITEQLQSNEDPIKHYVGDPGSNTNIQRVITETTDTATYKAINCACINTFGEAQYEAFLDQTDTTVTQEVLDSVLYEQSFQYIGCKRPELTITGRACAETVETYVSAGSEIDIRYLGQYSSIQNSLNQGNALTEPIITSWEYTDDNLALLRDLFIAQGKYPELFTGMPEDYKTYGDGNGNTLTRDFDNLAFLHTNQRTIVKEETIGGSPFFQIVLGDDGYNKDNSDKLTPVDLYSVPFFFHCDRSKINTYDNGQSTEFLCYGFATYSDKLGDGKRYIVIHPELSGGSASWISGVDPWNAGTQILGWDCHFTAYSSQFIMLWNGYLQYDYDGELAGVNGIASSHVTNGAQRQYESGAGKTTSFREQPCFLSTSAMLSKMYVGASNSALSFLTNGHFSWSYLHEPERKGQKYNAGDNPDNPIDITAKDEVYKINKVLNKWTWAPDYAPYDTLGKWEYGSKAGANNTPVKDASFVSPYYFTLDAQGPGGPSKNEWEPNEESQSFLNPRLTEFTLTDSMGGVFFNLGDAYTEDLWGESLLGILGFSYEQYNPKTIDITNNHLSRLTFKNIYNQDRWITTNSDVVATEVINYVMNRYNATQYTSQIPTSKWLPANAGYGTGTWGYQIPGGAQQFTPNIVENTQSIEAVAEDLPKKMLQSYYTIRSDIVMDNKYIGGNDIYTRGRGGGISHPVIAVVNKETTGDGDFYFSSGSDLQFTITKPINLNNITTSIHEPDGKLAQVGDNCCVIYKIQKQRKMDPNIIEEILQNMNKK